jgi:hypothetical protein
LLQLHKVVESHVESFGIPDFDTQESVMLDSGQAGAQPHSQFKRAGSAVVINL